MKKIYVMIGAILLIMSIEGCKKDTDTIGTHKPSISGKVIEVREDNEILVEITTDLDEYKKGDIILVGYSEYYWTDPEDPDAKKHAGVPKLNDEIGMGYWPHEVKEKDGYDYIPSSSVVKFQRELKGKVIQVREGNEILIEVKEGQDEYKRGDIILIGYSEYYWINPDDIKVTKHEDTPEYNDMISFGYWQENVGEKDGYIYISNIRVQNYLDSYEIE